MSESSPSVMIFLIFFALLIYPSHNAIHCFWAQLHGDCCSDFYVYLHLLSYFCHSIHKYFTPSVVGQELIIARRSSTEALYCFHHLMCAAIGWSIDSASLSVPSLFLNWFSTFSRVHESPRLESPMIDLWLL